MTAVAEFVFVMVRFLVLDMIGDGVRTLGPAFSEYIFWVGNGPCFCSTRYFPSSCLFFSPLVSASRVLHVSCSRVRTGNEDVRNSLGPKES